MSKRAVGALILGAVLAVALLAAVFRAGQVRGEGVADAEERGQQGDGEDGRECESTDRPLAHQVRGGG